MTGSPHLEWNRGNRQRSTSHDDGLIQVEHRVAGIGAAKLVFEPNVMDAAGRQLMEATRGEAEHAAIAIEGLSAALEADGVAIDREGRVREVVDEEPDRVALDAIDDDSNLPGQLGALGSRGERGRAGGEGEEKQQGQGEEESADESLEAGEVEPKPPVPAKVRGTQNAELLASRGDERWISRNLAASGRMLCASAQGQPLRTESRGAPDPTPQGPSIPRRRSRPVKNVTRSWGRCQ